MHSRRDWLQLNWRLRRRYALVHARLAVGPLQLFYTAVADPDVVLEEACQQEQQLPEGAAVSVPYWAATWDSALGLARYLAMQKRSVNGLTVLDLGCGMGLSGMAAAALGARVLLGDIETPALLFARLNTWQWRETTDVRRIDWGSDVRPGQFGEAFSRPFDRILGADVLYDVSQWPAIERFCSVHLARGGQVFFGEPGRASGDKFIDWIADRGWDVRIDPLPIVAKENRPPTSGGRGGAGTELNGVRPRGFESPGPNLRVLVLTRSSTRTR